MANTTVYPFGTEGKLPGGVAIVNDPYTGGADKAGSAEMIKYLNAEVFYYDPQDIASLSTVQAFISASQGTWFTNDSNYKCKFLPVRAGATYLVQAPAARGVRIAILQNTTHTSGTTPNYATGCEYVLVPAGIYQEFSIPSDGKYMYIGVLNNGNDCTPQEVSEKISRISGGGEGDEARMDGFYTAPERFAWLKLQQASKIKWTPLKGTIQKANSTTKFTANTEYTGIPYSSVTEYDKRVGYDVSFHTFMTAIHNKYSVMYTECIRKAYSQSAYGITYYGPNNSGPYYGMVCSNYISYGLETVPYVTGDMARLATEGIMEVIYDQSANGVQRFDIIWRSGHTRIVKDVWRKNGIPTSILVSEESGSAAIMKETLMTPAEFDTLIASESCIIYRYKELYKDIHYAPSPYVAVGDEEPQTVTYNDDICTFAGDRAAFAEGDLIYIHCLNLDFPQMEIYKDDVLIDTVTLASDSRAALTSDTLAYAVNLSNDNLTYGKYKCRLKDGDTYSDYTYFEVINASVTIEGDTATYSSANAVAVAWYWTEYHSNDGQATYNMSPLPGNASGTIDVSNRRTGFPLLKVLFRGEYGNVAAKFLES